MKPLKSLLLLLCLALPVLAVTNRYVDAAAPGPTHDGTTWNNAWLTFAAVNQAGLSGDYVVWVKSGTYNERFTIAKSGTSGHLIWYVGTGPTKPVLRGINGAAFTDIAIINLEVTQLSSANNYNAIALAGSGDLRWLIEDNYIHDTYQNGIGGTNGSNNSKLIIRHNTFEKIAYIGLGSSQEFVNIGYLEGDDELVEYNTFINGLDRMDMFGTRLVIRSNLDTGTNAGVYTGTSRQPEHVDFWQTFQGKRAVSYVYLSRNFHRDNADTAGGNGHFWLAQDQPTGANNMRVAILSFNQVIRTSGAPMEFANFGQDSIHNNNFVGCHTYYYAQGTPYGYIGTFTYASPGNSDNPTASDTMDFRNNAVTYSLGTQDAAGLVTALPTHATGGTNFAYTTGANHGEFFTGTPANLTSVANNATPPLYVDGTGVAGHDNYRLQSGSPLRGAGSSINLALNSGTSATTVSALIPKQLFDGWGLVPGNRIKIGASGTPVRVVSVNTTTGDVVIAAARTWSISDPIFEVGATDVGALPYGAADPSISSATYLLAGGNYTFTVTVGDAFSVNSVEVLDNHRPIAMTYDPIGNVFTLVVADDGSTHDFNVRAFAEWSGTVLAVETTPSAADIPPADSLPVARIRRSAALNSP